MHGITTKLFGRNIETANNFKACVLYVRTAARLTGVFATLCCCYRRPRCGRPLWRGDNDNEGVERGTVAYFNSSLFFPSYFLIFSTMVGVEFNRMDQF